MNRKIVHRAEDGEHVGYVVPVPDSPHWQPLTVFGYPLGDPASYDDAVTWLAAAGLAALAGRWAVHHGGDWYGCRIEETSPDSVRVRITDFGSADYGAALTLSRPGAAELRPA